MIKTVFNTIKDVVGYLVELLTTLLCLGVIVEIVFGAGVFGFTVIDNIVNLIARFGQSGFVGLLALLVIVILFKNK
ncbi:MAG: hypothetical protein H8E13_08975 [Actinobacteria bacterium]|nr:hypothetical protein [Actinomycetota bacterium]